MLGFTMLDHDITRHADLGVKQLVVPNRFDSSAVRGAVATPLASDTDMTVKNRAQMPM
jgi:hypothetical protein